MKRILLLALAMCGSMPWASTSPSDSLRGLGRIAVLDLVDLTDNTQKPEFSDALRAALSAGGTWAVLQRDSVSKRLGEFNINPRQGCNNPQCGFDIGNVVQAEYVVYGTATPLASVEAVSLKLLHIPTARIVWTKVLEADGTTDADRQRSLEKAFAACAAEIAKLKPDTEKGKHGKSLAVFDLSENSPQSRAFFERVCTRIYGNPAYDLMSPTELAELLSALEINKYSVTPSLENMIGLGQKLGVSSLLYSRLYRDGRSYVYRLAMYDVAAKSLVLELPPQPSEDLIKLLDYEKVFFNTLFNKEKDSPATAAVKDGSKSNKALWISLGVLGIGGGVAAYWVENLHKEDNRPGTSGTGTGTIPPPPNPPSETQ
ncbi:MAG: hypothetical protein JF616_12710 [Fibrobacteres bacterium]|nr:hypothetical protein [Fibrobacterota bacterium]